MTPEEIDLMAVDTVGEDMEVTGLKSEDALNKNKWRVATKQADSARCGNHSNKDEEIFYVRY